MTHISPGKKNSVVTLINVFAVDPTIRNGGLRLLTAWRGCPRGG